MAFNNEDILALAKAGFTAQQIAALNTVQQAPAPQPEPAPAPQPEPQPAPAPAPQPEPQPAPAPAPQPAPSTNDILAEISALHKDMQSALLQTSQQPNGGQPQTSEQILAQIINPTYPQKEGGK